MVYFYTQNIKLIPDMRCGMFDFGDAITGLVELPIQIEFVGWTSLEGTYHLMQIECKNA